MEVDGEELGFRGTFADKEITLHDAIMMDDPRTEELLDNIYYQWQLAQSKWREHENHTYLSCNINHAPPILAVKQFGQYIG